MSDRLAPIAPLFIARDNAVAAVGREWRVVQDLARELGVRPRRVGRVALYVAAELVAAIERHASASEPSSSEQSEIDDLEALRRALGKRRRA
jgi:hypothetical protein